MNTTTTSLAHKNRSLLQETLAIYANFLPKKTRENPFFKKRRDVQKNSKNRSNVTITYCL